MSLTNDDLLAISSIMDNKLTPIKNQLTRIEVDLIENNILPRLNTIESCFQGSLYKT